MRARRSRSARAPSSRPTYFLARSTTSTLVFEPKPEMLVRSYIKSRLAISQPPLSRPTMLAFGILTSVKKVSQNGDEPEMSLIGRVSTPFVVMSMRTKEIPSYFTPVYLRTRHRHQREYMCAHSRADCPVSNQ